MGDGEIHLGERNGPDVLFRNETGRIAPVGSLTHDTVSAIWKPSNKIPAGVDGQLVFDASGVTECDSAGLALLVMLRRQAEKSGLSFSVVGLAPEKMAIFESMVTFSGAPVSTRSRVPFFEAVGRKVASGHRETLEFLSFLGELAVCFCYAIRHPRRVRWGDWALVLERAGVDAVPVVLLIGFLLGVILSFESVIPLKMFGAEIYVANLIGIAVVRELGTLVAAIVMSGRTASAFAAEIGTMTVNEEISALRTMGIEPVRFLALPRVLAVAVALPLLSIFAGLAGLAGGFLVISSLGYSFQAYCAHAIDFVKPSDLLGTLAKAVVFGVLIGGVGCLRGLQTGKGADSVGRSTTRAVVSSIIAFAVADGIFAVVFYVLGI